MKSRESQARARGGTGELRNLAERVGYAHNHLFATRLVQPLEIQRIFNFAPGLRFSEETRRGLERTFLVDELRKVAQAKRPVRRWMQPTDTVYIDGQFEAKIKTSSVLTRSIDERIVTESSTIEFFYPESSRLHAQREIHHYVKTESDGNIVETFTRDIFDDLAKVRRSAIDSTALKIWYGQAGEGALLLMGRGDDEKELRLKIEDRKVVGTLHH